VPRPIVGLLAIGLLAGACAAPAESATSAAASGDSASESQSVAPSTASGLLDVRATANLFGAGHDDAPAPGGDGGGQLPLEVPLPDGARTVTFPSVTGETTLRSDIAPYYGPNGSPEADTDVESFGGISGMVNDNGCLFLAGVFLTDDEPADPAPPRLDFSSDNQTFDLLEPEIAQTFFIGDGVGRSYTVPDGATRLFLGVLDAFMPGFNCHGPPGYYGNNSGGYQVEVDVSTD